MPAKQLQGIIHHLRRTVGARGLREVPDAELLKRFTADRDEAAFELLVWRHGKMVFNVCRRICRGEHDAEDAFQAAFLALVRKAGSILKHESVGGWLYKVAYRVAQTAGARAARRTGRVHEAADLESVPGSADPVSTAAWREVRRLIDEELDRLPEKYRLPFVLCHLEGHSNADAARELGCPVGTLESRLTRARQRLRSGLAHRGVTLSAGLSVALLSRHAASACVPAELVLGTVKAAMCMAAGHAAAGLISAKVVALTEGVLKTMFVTKLKTAAAVLIAAGVIAAGGWTYRSMAMSAAAADDGPSKITSKDADADRIAKLIERLGSDTFAEREAASRELERLGVAALEALRKATQSNDVETRRRAETLVKKIDKDVASRELLQAKQVRLRFKDTPLPEAVAELAKQSGYDIALDDPDGKLKERKVTLDTDDMPFWRAVDLLCRAGGVVEADDDGLVGIKWVLPGAAGGPGLPAGAGGPLPAMPILPGAGRAVPAPAGGALPPPRAKVPPAAPIEAPPAPNAKPLKETGAQPAPPAKLAPPTGGDAPAAAPPGGKIAPAAGVQPAGKAPPAAAKKEKPPAPAAGGWGVKLPIGGGPGGPPAGFVLKAPPALAGVNAPLGTNRLVLKDGKAAMSPTAYVGAARVRAIRNSKFTPAKPARDGETNVGLQFSLEPKLSWQRLTTLTLRIDKAVDDQGQTLAEVTSPLAGTEANYNGVTNVQFVGSDRGVDLFRGPDSYTTLRLKKGEKPAKTLKELKGRLTAEVLGPVKPIITVDNLLKAAGKTFKGNDGGSLEVLEVVKGDDDQITVKLALDPPADWAPGIAMAGVLAAPVALPRPGGALPPPPLPAAKLPPLPAAPVGGAIALGVPANSQQSEISLVDAQGKAVQTTRHIVSYRGGDKGFTHMHEFTFQLPKDQDTIKLVFSGRRPATIDVPFTLKEVPLP